MQAKKKGIAERAGAWSAAHRKTAILGWIAFVVAALMIGSSIGTEELTSVDSQPGESGKAERTLIDSGLQPAFEEVLVQSDTLEVTDPGFESAITDLTETLGEVPVVRDVSSPLDDASTVSKDEHSALVQFELKGDPETAGDRVGPVIDAVTAAADRHPELSIEQFGEASANEALNDVFADDLHKAETLSLPITLVILVLAFGSLVAAGIPLLLGISAVMATFGLVALPSQLFAVDENIASVILLIGLAVGVDYTLFYLRREREERSGRSQPGRGPADRLGDLGSRGAGLRPDGDGRDGGHAADRRSDVHLVRDRHDAGRRSRDGGLGHGPAGGARRARRPGRSGTDSVPRRG